jgi:hypothetical protein
MGNGRIEDGWQRFLDRLKRLWGKLRGGDVPSTAIITAVTLVR